MRVLTALPYVVAMVTLWMAGDAAFGQEALPETPPELRDFRLDPERAAPQQPQPEQPAERAAATPPPVVPTIPEREPAQARPQPTPQRAEQPPTTTETATVATEPEPVVPTPEESSDFPEAATAEAEPAAKPLPTFMPYWQIAGGLGLLVLLLIAGWWFRRRRKSEQHDHAVYQEPVARPQPVETVPTFLPMISAAAPEYRKKPKNPNITLDFIPEKAILSVSMLTVKGQLRLVNHGDASAHAMELRVGLVSASAAQDQDIQAFHATSNNVKPEPLGDAAPGERIGMAIELSVPLADMGSFAVGDRQLLVPIMVANLSYHGANADGVEVARIACMIGREADPPAPKMGPLRLDRGPRSFANLGQRPLSA